MLNWSCPLPSTNAKLRPTDQGGLFTKTQANGHRIAEGYYVQKVRMDNDRTKTQNVWVVELYCLSVRRHLLIKNCISAKLCVGRSEFTKIVTMLRYFFWSDCGRSTRELWAKLMHVLFSLLDGPTELPPCRYFIVECQPRSDNDKSPRTSANSTEISNCAKLVPPDQFYT